jgi:hypothetical protein
MRRLIAWAVPNSFAEISYFQGISAEFSTAILTGFSAAAGFPTSPKTDQLCYAIDSSVPKTSFLKYIAEEMELACGWGTNNGLVIRGEQAIVKRVTALFSHEVRCSIQKLPLIPA